MNSRSESQRKASQLARALGWFSIGLGLAELLAPKKVARMAGLRQSKAKLIRIYGAREVGNGIAILVNPTVAESVWSRVAGDALDLASLGAAFASPFAKKGRLAIATANVAAVTALDVICAQRLSQAAAGSQAPVAAL
jgi:hypothetical protein